MKTIFLIILALLVIYILFQAFRINQLRLVGHELVEATTPYQQTPDSPTKRILIIGDSLQAGVGASSPETSMAGLLGSKFPNWQITNLAQSGDETGDALKKLQNFKESDFDLAIVQIGANDIFHRVDLQTATNNLKKVLKITKEKSTQVLFVTSGSIGYAPLFPLPLDYYFTNRSREFIPAFLTVAEDLGVETLNNYRAREEDLFEESPEKYYAADKFHLSDQGYLVWHERLIDKLSTIGFTN